MAIFNRRNIEEASFDWKLKRLVPFLLVKSVILPFCSAFLFSVVEMSEHYVFYNPHTFSRPGHNLNFTEKKAMDYQFSTHILI